MLMLGSDIALAVLPPNFGVALLEVVKLQWKQIALIGSGCFFVGGCATLKFLKVVVERVYTRPKLLPPTSRQLKDERPEDNPLYRLVPALRGKFAWRALGEFPTPVERWTIDVGSKSTGDQGKNQAEFWVKREDLSGTKYGGNKVRTLQYILASFESYQEDCAARRLNGEPTLDVMGSSGSNQIIATKVYADQVGIPAESIMAISPFGDAPETDNTLNFLSGLSLPGRDLPFLEGTMRLLSLAFHRKDEQYDVVPWILPPGGNCCAGVLGQVGGCIELAEQICRGESPDPDGIVVALGSTCTTTGLVLGVALARELGMAAFQKPGFRIHAQPVNPAFTRMHQFFGMLISESLPFMIGRGLREAAGAIADAGGPDVTERALAVMREECVISTDLDICGKYGAHSNVSKLAKDQYDRAAWRPEGALGLWLCGHFSGKSFALLLQLMRQDDAKAKDQKRCFVFWQTKSQVQPLGNKDEWQAWQGQLEKNGKSLKKWGVIGGVTGHPQLCGTACVETKAETVQNPVQYKPLMKNIYRTS